MKAGERKEEAISSFSIVEEGKAKQVAVCCVVHFASEDSGRGDLFIYIFFFLSTAD